MSKQTFEIQHSFNEKQIHYFTRVPITYVRLFSYITYVERTYSTSVASVSRRTNTSKRVDAVHTRCPILAWVWATVVDIWEKKPDVVVIAVVFVNDLTNLSTVVYEKLMGPIEIMLNVLLARLWLVYPGGYTQVNLLTLVLSTVVNI